MKRIGLMLCILVTLFTSSGCMNAHSLDRYAYVLAIGFDKGETLPYKVTLMLQNMQAGSDNQKSDGFTLVSAECRNLYEAIETLSGGMPLQIDCARTHLMVISAELAQQDDILTELINMSFARLRIRSNVNLFLSLSSAYDALDGFKNKLDPNLGKMQMNFVSYSNATGLIPVANIMHALEAVSDQTRDAILPVCGVTPDKLRLLTFDSVGGSDYAYVGGNLMIESDMKTGLAGCALFDGKKLVGILDGQNTQLVLMALGDFQEGRMQLTLTDGTVMSVYLRAAGRPRAEITLYPTPKITLRVSLAADVETPEMKRIGANEQVERVIAEALTMRFNRLFYGCRALNSDAFGFGRYAVMQFHDTAAWEQYDWKAAYGQAEAELIPSIKLADHLEEPNIE